MPTLDINKEITKEKAVCIAFMESPNDSQIILRNYRSAIKSCRAALEILKRAKSQSCGLKEGSRIDVKNCKTAFEEHLRFFTDEAAMRQLVEVGQLPNYIFDTIKDEVFDRPEAYRELDL
jgi:hypothetical protein